MQWIFLVLTIIAGRNNQATYPATADKILEIAINESGTITSMGETLAADKITQYVKERLFKSWIGGKIYSKIKLTSSSANEITKETAIKEIQEGQRQALIAICLESFRTRFENLDPKKQEKLREKYPALFQTEY